MAFPRTLLALALCSLACDTEGGAGDTDGESGLPAACSCAGDACETPLCDTVWYDVDQEGGGDFDDSDTDSEADPADPITCALEALRDGTPGTIGFSFHENGGQYIDVGTVSVDTNRSAVKVHSGVDDLCYDETDTIEHGPLRSASFFDNCLDKPYRRDRFACVRDALAPGATVCQDADRNCDGV